MASKNQVYDSGIKGWANALKAYERENKMAYGTTGDREDEDMGKGQGEVPGAVYVRDDVSTWGQLLAGKWAYFGPLKWVGLAAFELISLVIFAGLMSINPLLGIVMAPVFLAGFLPYMITQHLKSQNRIIILDAYEGFGSNWQKELTNGLVQLEKLTVAANHPDASFEIKAAFQSLEPIFWNDAVKVSELLKNFNGSDDRIDANAKALLRRQYADFVLQIKALEKVFVSVNTFKMLNVDIDISNVAVEEVAQELENQLSARMELAASTYDSREVADHVIVEYSDGDSSMEDTLHEISRSLMENKSKDLRLQKRTA